MKTHEIKYGSFGDNCSDVPIIIDKSSGLPAGTFPNECVIYPEHIRAGMGTRILDTARQKPYYMLSDMESVLLSEAKEKCILVDEAVKAIQAPYLTDEGAVIYKETRFDTPDRPDKEVMRIIGNLPKSLIDANKDELHALIAYVDDGAKVDDKVRMYVADIRNKIVDDFDDVKPHVPKNYLSTDEMVQKLEDAGFATELSDALEGFMKERGVDGNVTLNQFLDWYKAGSKTAPPKPESSVDTESLLSELKNAGFSDEVCTWIKVNTFDSPTSILDAYKMLAKHLNQSGGEKNYMMSKAQAAEEAHKLRISNSIVNSVLNTMPSEPVNFVQVLTEVCKKLYSQITDFALPLEEFALKYGFNDCPVFTKEVPERSDYENFFADFEKKCTNDKTTLMTKEQITESIKNLGVDKKYVNDLIEKLPDTDNNYVKFLEDVVHRMDTVVLNYRAPIESIATQLHLWETPAVEKDIPSQKDIHELLAGFESVILDKNGAVKMSANALRNESYDMGVPLDMVNDFVATFGGDEINSYDYLLKLSQTMASELYETRFDLISRLKESIPDVAEIAKPFDDGKISKVAFYEAIIQHLNEQLAQSLTNLPSDAMVRSVVDDGVPQPIANSIASSLENMNNVSAKDYYSHLVAHMARELYAKDFDLTEQAEMQGFVDEDIQNSLIPGVPSKVQFYSDLAERLNKKLIVAQSAPKGSVEYGGSGCAYVTSRA